MSARWAQALRLGGSLLFEVGIGQAADVESLMKAQGFSDVRSTQDTQGIWRVTEGVING